MRTILRYVTLHCSYVDFWDVGLHRVLALSDITICYNARFQSVTSLALVPYIWSANCAWNVIESVHYGSGFFAVCKVTGYYSTWQFFCLNLPTYLLTDHPTTSSRNNIDKEQSIWISVEAFWVRILIGHKHFYMNSSKARLPHFFF